MSKILFNLNGQQQLVEVGQGGAVTPQAEILWDERLHGSLPEISLGKMQASDVNGIRQLNTLADEIPTHASAMAIQNQSKINRDAQSYLASTDWYILRELDSGVTCPNDIKQARAAARARIV